MREDIRILSDRLKTRLAYLSEIGEKSDIEQKRFISDFVRDTSALIEGIGKCHTTEIGNDTLRVIKAMQAVALAKSPVEILKLALSHAAGMTGARNGAIILRGEYESSRDPSITFPVNRKTEIQYIETQVGSVFNTGCVLSTILDEDEKKRESATKALDHHIHIEPISVNEETIAVIYLEVPVSDLQLQTSTVSLLKDFTSFVSAIYERILLNERRFEFLQKDRQNVYRVMIGKSEGIRHIDELLDRYAPLNRPVLILGETGTGKRVVAEEIHRRSKIPGPFVVMNCGGIPETLFEAEFFGYVKGAFTDAYKDYRGYIAQAQDGTLLLDEIGELSLNSQVKLLQFLDDKTYKRLGEEKTHTSNARVLTATNRNLPERVKEKLFREDLYYRLNVLTIELPPLRIRVDDIPVLADFFVVRECDNINRQMMKLDDDVLKRLQLMPWKGNVRELKNLIQRLVIHSDSDRITMKDLEYQLDPRQQKTERLYDDMQELDENQVVEMIRRRALLIENGNCAAAARRLGISAPTLHKWMKKNDISYKHKS